MILTVFLSDYPTIQAMGHQVLSISYLVYIISDDLIDSVERKIVECSSEFLGMVAANVLCQSLIYESEKASTVYTVTFIFIIVIIFAINITYMVRAKFRDRAEKKRAEELLA